MTGSLAQVVSVRGRFHRSVNLAQDWANQSKLTEYVVTPTIRELAQHFISELKESGGTRAWSVTGPYGSGKSAFALFVTDILASSRPSQPEGLRLRQALGYPKRRFLPILLVADRKPLQPMILEATAGAFRTVSPQFARSLRRLATRSSSADELASCLTRAAEEARRKRYGGVLLVIDELGKFLEYAAEGDERGDLFFLQALAEAASRSPHPILFVTILHSSFADYLPAGDETRRAEWQKVQGRFRDVPFQLPAEQMLALIGAALSRDASAGVPSSWTKSVEVALKSEALGDVRARLPAHELLYRCLPLHPATALLLWPLFRSKAAQNERSLFAFLTSHEPFGFQEFLRKAQWSNGSAPLYRLPELHDYLAHALGLAAFRGDQARKWALISDALSRLPSDASETCRSLVKAIGLLDMYGAQVGLKASLETLELALGAPHGEVQEAIAFLESRSIVLCRRHLGAYGLWEGSDVDLESILKEARHRVRQGNLADRLRRVLTLRPIVARAHYIESGTLRFFEADVASADPESLKAALTPTSSADGRIVFVVDVQHIGVEGAKQLAEAVTADIGPLNLVALPRGLAELGDALQELECWLWIRDNTLELQGDAVARQEVRARIAAARDRFEEVAGRVFGLPGHPFEPERSLWVHRGKTTEVGSSVAFQRWLSKLCDQVFSCAPRFHNELLNRQTLSSAASAARRNLLERMVSRAESPRLGIEGTPPEASMYESMLRAGGFHGPVRKGVWGFAGPKGEWRPVWDAITRFAAEAQDVRRPVVELLDQLKRPPYGLREGPLPVLLTAALVAKRDEIALYEEGVYVPDVRVEVIERLTRSPETFEVQSHKLDRSQRSALHALERIVVGEDSAKSRGRANRLLPVARALVRFAAQLNPYAKQTRRVNPPEAARVRDELLRARDPRQLLFVDLPRALGLSVQTGTDAEGFAARLRECLGVVARAYADLLDGLERQIRDAFGLTGSAVTAREQLRRRAAPLLEFAIEKKLQLFVREAAAEHAGRDWREILARVVNGGLPPSHWRDADVTAFQIQLQEVASEFLRMEELVAEKARTGATRVVRIGILDGGLRETRAVIPITEELDSTVRELVRRVKEALDGPQGDNGVADRARLAALARVAAGLLERDDEEGSDG